MKANKSYGDVIETKKKTKIINKYDGKIMLICSKCFSHKTIRVKYNIKFNYTGNNRIIYPFMDVDLGCNCKCGKFEVDSNIGKAIVKLNKKGYKTKFCCEGHGKYIPAYIYFEENYEELMKKIPKHWYIDRGDFEDNVLVIRAECGVSLKKRIDSLNKWVKKLECIK